MTTLMTNDAFMMVNLRGRSTGLPCNIWLGQRGLAHEAPHIHVQPDHRSQFDLNNLAVVGVDPVEVIEGDLIAQDLALVRRYILLNRLAILLERVHRRRRTHPRAQIVCLSYFFRPFASRTAALKTGLKANFAAYVSRYSTT